MSSNCNVCCNLNGSNKSILNNNKKFCNKLIYTNNYTFWLEQNRNYQKYLYINNKLYCTDPKCNAYQQNSTIPKKQYKTVSSFF